MKKLVVAMFTVMILLTGCKTVCTIDSIDVLSQVLEQNTELEFQQISIYDQTDAEYIINYNAIDENNVYTLEEFNSGVGCTLIDYKNELIYSINIFEIGKDDLDTVESSLNLANFAKYALGTDLFNNTVLIYDNFVIQIFSDSEIDNIISSLDNVNYTNFTYDNSTAFNKTINLFKSKPEKNIKTIANIGNLFNSNLSDMFTLLGDESDENSYMMINSDSEYISMVIQCDNNIEDASAEIKAKYDAIDEAPFNSMVYSISDNYIIIESSEVVDSAE